MPFINVKTNIPVSENAQEALKTRLGQAIEAIPGKSEAWLMVGVEPECALWFQGTDAPAALVEVSVYGGAEPDAYDALTARVCELLDAVLDIDPARVYVKYAETPNWGYRGLVTFVSDVWPTEYMHLFTSDAFEGTLAGPCVEGELAWVEKSAVPGLPLWEGDRIFLRLLAQEAPFFSLKLVYRGSTLVSASLNGRPCPPEPAGTP